MSEFAQRFLNEDWENLPQAPRIYVGAFGKHPAWNDHMDDVGLLTSSLVMLRRSLYGAGIASQIESAAWDRAGAEKTLATFDHTFVWRRGGESLVGRIWSSRDGIGRALFPMTAVVHSIGQRFEFLAQEVAPALEAAKAGCVAATVSTAVLASLAEAQRTLRVRAGVTDNVGVVDSLIGIDGWTAYFSLDRTDLERVFHHLRVNLGLFAPGAQTWATGDGPARSRCLRLPRVPGSTAMETLNAWISFLETQIDPAVPLLGLVHRDATWVDVVVGEPAAADFFVLRANLQGAPLVTDVPYQLDAESRQRMEPLLNDIIRRRRLPTQSLLNGAALVDNREAADRWLAKFRTNGRSGFLSRLIPTGGARASSRFDLRVT